MPPHPARTRVVRLPVADGTTVRDSIRDAGRAAVRERRLIPEVAALQVTRRRLARRQQLRGVERAPGRLPHASDVERARDVPRGEVHPECVLGDVQPLPRRRTCDVAEAGLRDAVPQPDTYRSRAYRLRVVLTATPAAPPAAHVTRQSTSDMPCELVAMAGPVAPAGTTISAPTSESVSCPKKRIAETLWFTSVRPTPTGTGCELSR